MFPLGLVFFYSDMEGYKKEPPDFDEYLQATSAPPFDGSENCEDVEKQLDMIIYGRVVDENEIDAGDWEKELDK